jgi:hypothetical protein
MKKFEDTDIFVNTIKTHPKVKLFGYNGKIFINNTSETSIKLNHILPIPIERPLEDGGILTEQDGFLLITEDGNYLLIE